MPSFLPIITGAVLAAVAGSAALAGPILAYRAPPASQTAVRLTQATARIAAGPVGPTHIFLVEQLRVTQPWAIPAAGATETTGYVSVENRGASPDRLTGASVEVADRVTIVPSGPSPATAGLVIPPGATLDLKPDAAHFVLEGLHRPLRDGDHFNGVIRFERAGPLKVEFVVNGTMAN